MTDAMMSGIADRHRDPFPVRVPIAFPDDLYEWLRGAAFQNRTSMAEVVRDALREYRQRHEPQLPLPLSDRGPDS